MKNIRLYGTTDSSGDLTVNGSRSVVGKLYAIRWIDGDLADGVDAVISTQGAEASGTILTLTDANVDKMYYVREESQGPTGADLSKDETLPLIVGTPRLVVSSGGDKKSGGCILFYEE